MEHVELMSSRFNTAVDNLLITIARLILIEQDKQPKNRALQEIQTIDDANKVITAHQSCLPETFNSFSLCSKKEEENKES
jgi:hypothetical protein